jgi:broad specificity phosphatase PhoE
MSTHPTRRRIYLLRHGHVRYADRSGALVADPDQVALSEKGREQADAAGRYLKNIGVARFDKVVSSNLPRTIETARRALATHGQAGEPEPWPALREIKGGHGKDGARWSSPHEMPGILAAFAKPSVPLATQWMGGETAGDACARILPALEQLRADTSWETALLALHNMVNVVILSHAITGGRAYLGSLEQNFGCVNVLDVGPSGHDWIVRALNICPEPTHYERTRSHSLEIMAEQAARRKS